MPTTQLGTDAAAALRLHRTRKDGTADATPPHPRKASHGYCGWVIERSFAWAARFRRLARDYERWPETLAGLHFLAFAILWLTRFVTLMAESA